MAIFGTFYYKLGNVWPLEYIAHNGEVFYLKSRTKEQLVFNAAYTLYCAEGKKNNAVVEYPAVAQMDADCNEHCTIECAGRQLRLNAKECRLGGSRLSWEERKRIIDNIKG
ncbi:MAG: hypothetical protein E7088_01855 [Bacteroidales bacterium]|nr:hypothetical protein [Bacteroidales bacterium]